MYDFIFRHLCRMPGVVSILLALSSSSTFTGAISVITPRVIETIATVHYSIEICHPERRISNLIGNMQLLTANDAVMGQVPRTASGQLNPLIWLPRELKTTLDQWKQHEAVECTKQQH